MFKYKNFNYKDVEYLKILNKNCFNELIIMFYEVW